MVEATIPVEVEVKNDYRIWLRYSDGTSGEVDLDYLAGRGVFKAWDTPGFFETARVTKYGFIAWGEGDDIELCPSALYMRLTGKSLEEMWPDSVAVEIA